VSLLAIAPSIPVLQTPRKRSPKLALAPHDRRKRHRFTHDATIFRPIHFWDVLTLVKAQRIAFDKSVASLFPIQNRLPILQLVRQRL
jgi:hypothetical protein